MKKVLVLLSTYNGEKYLEELLNSLLVQKGVEINILVRDDGSCDRTTEILKNYENGNKLKYYEGENIRSLMSFMDLIMQASLDYDYYAFCDQDDYWEEFKIQRSIECLSEYDCSIPCLYYSGQKLVDKNLKLLSNHIIDCKRSLESVFIFNQAAGCTSVFNRALLVKLKKYSPQGIYNHDSWAFKLCVALGGNIFRDASGYILYRQHGSNVVGVNNSLLGKIQRSIKLLRNRYTTPYIKQLFNGYDDEIDEKWKDFLQTILLSENSAKAKIKLLFNKNIKFNNSFLRIIFYIKVLIGTL